MTTHISSSNKVDWLSKIHAEAFPTENLCSEVMLDVHDTAMQSEPFTTDDLVAALHKVIDMIAPDDLPDVLYDLKTFLESDDRFDEVGSEEWVWKQNAEMLLEEEGMKSFQPSESYAEKLADAYVRHGGFDPLILNVEGFLGVKDPIFSPPPPPPPPPKFQIKMPDFGIETTMITEPSRKLDRSWEWNTDDLIFTISVTEQTPMAVEDILFSPIEKEEYC